MGISRLRLAFAAALLGAGPALGATPVGSEFQVNTHTTSSLPSRVPSRQDGIDHRVGRIAMHAGENVSDRPKEY